jgi:alpha-mannosidase
VTPLIECFHEGLLPATQSYLTVTGADNVIVSVLKRAEANDGTVILRAYEIAGEAAEVTIDLPFLGRSLPATFTPYEIKSLRLPADGSPTEVDLLEWDPALPPPVAGH